MILVTGASGTMGRAVLDEVVKTGAPFRAMYRSQEDANRFMGGKASVIADFADKESLRQALEGVETVYLVCSPIPSLVELENNMIEACQAGGVKHVVLNSAMGAGDYGKSFPSWHRQVEDKLRASGMGFTIFRPNSFMQNILMYYAPSIRQQGAFYAAMGGARMSYLDGRDIGAVVSKALISPVAHSGRVYELNGPEAIAYSELAARISRIANRAVSYVDIPEATQRKNMLELGMPDWQVTALLDLQAYYTAGQGGEVTDVLRDLLERPPTTLDEFLTEFKSEFRS